MPKFMTKKEKRQWLEDYEYARRIWKETNLTQTDIAKQLRISTTKVSSMIAGNIPPQVQKFLDEGEQDA